MAGQESFGIPGVPFPVGVEYYRAPTPKPEVWDEDLARIRASGMRIVRSFTMWNSMEPRPGQYELDEFDRLFDLAEKHDLYVWLDMALATHGAGPEWMTRDYPDIRVVNQRGPGRDAGGECGDAAGGPDSLLRPPAVAALWRGAAASHGDALPRSAQPIDLGAVGRHCHLVGVQPTNGGAALLLPTHAGSL